MLTYIIQNNNEMFQKVHKNHMETKTTMAKVAYVVTCTEGVGRSDVTGFPCEDRSENRRSTAVKVSDHLVEGHIQLQTRTRQQVCSLVSSTYIVSGNNEISKNKPIMSYTFEFSS